MQHVLIIHEVETYPDDARRFFQSHELEGIKQKAGAKPPDFIYLSEIERGVL